MDENQFWRDLAEDLQDPRFKKVFMDEMLRLQRQRLVQGLGEVLERRIRRSAFFSPAVTDLPVPR